MNRCWQYSKTGDSVSIDVYGDIAPAEQGGFDVAALSRKLEGLDASQTVDVYINSYGGDVGEGLAIYNALLRTPARVVTHCDGFACSIASVIFMAGEERIMNEASLLMVHNAWAYGEGNAAELRKQADDLDSITEASRHAYLSRVNITPDELGALMDAETWISPEQAVEMGFATSIEQGATAPKAAQAARTALFERIRLADADQEDEEEDEMPNEIPEDLEAIIERAVRAALADEEEPESDAGDGEDPEEPLPEAEPEDEPEEEPDEVPEGESEDEDSDEEGSINQMLQKFINVVF